MIKILLVVVSSLIAVSGFTQSSLVVFAENGESFSMTVDGAEAESLSDSRVKYEGIKGDFVQVRITFKDQFPEPMKKSIMIESNSEITLILKQNRKGVYVLRPMSTVPVSSIVRAESPPPHVIVEEVEVYQEISNAPIDEVVTTTTTTTSESTPTSINMGVGGSQGGIKLDVNININDSEMLTDGHEVTSTSTTITTTTTTTSSSSSPNYSDDIIRS